MKNSLLILAGAAALSLASCSQEKTTEVNTVPADGTMTTTTTTTTGPMTDAQIEARAQQIADKMAANMKITDEATKTKIRTVYVNRYKRINDLRTKYTTDTTGMAAAMRDANKEQDQEFKVIFVDPTQYQAYESSRSSYYDDGNYTSDNASMSSMDSTSSGAMSPSSTTTETSTTTTTDAGTDAMGATKLKAKAEDGSKIKVKENGKMKTKDADGTKVKN
ncbi:hypothetical protein Q3A66_01890 [Hymenobacter sp. BT770]|uniref:hypothetical protein n=1 Tax=Hymenobacter sp. BT770 TaxID=2886942 RepID=UPI001D103796|nr:hypothetical protein [Hymenobacter sp. BT770]MCC3151621.1 hypothetical protein [Hymenobacter sp. BT770]MDO3413802.1 hypothetical protein [Hymenobacter sp. BT770]